jgi:hypothetical protein
MLRWLFVQLYKLNALVLASIYIDIQQLESSMSQTPMMLDSWETVNETKKPRGESFEGLPKCHSSRAIEMCPFEIKRGGVTHFFPIISLLNALHLCFEALEKNTQL